MKEKKRKKVGIVLIAIIVLCIIGIIASPSDDKKDDSNPKQTEQQNTEVTEQASETTEPKTEEKDEPAEIDGVDIIFSDTAEEYAADYYKQYFKADNEVHAVVNFTLNTTACITCVGDTLNVRIYEHIKDEEQYAENLLADCSRFFILHEKIQVF